MYFLRCKEVYALNFVNSLFVNFTGHVVRLASVVYHKTFKYK